MEIHRLKPMQIGYDQELFNKLFKETQSLRFLLSTQIDARRYGVTRDIIESWFTDKFIFVFNKYYGKMDENLLKANIINSLKVFKYRILRYAYSNNNINNNTIHIEDNDYYINFIPFEGYNDNTDELLELANKFMKKRLSSDAYFLLQLELNPPGFITNKLKSNSTKIPNKLIAEYLDLSSDYIPYITELRKEISEATKEAKEYFMQ